MKKNVIGGLLIATTLGMTTLAVAQSDGQMHGGKSGIANAGHGNYGQVASQNNEFNNIVGGASGVNNGYGSGTGERSEQGQEALFGAYLKQKVWGQ